MNLPAMPTDRPAVDAEPVPAIFKLGGHARTVAYMLARGSFPEDIQLATGLNEKQVRLLMTDNEVKETVRSIVSEEKDLDPRILLRSYLPAAIQLLGEATMNANLHIRDRVAAAKEILNRNLGAVPLGPEPKARKNPVEEYNELLRAQNSKSVTLSN